MEPASPQSERGSGRGRLAACRIQAWRQTRVSRDEIRRALDRKLVLSDDSLGRYDAKKNVLNVCQLPCPSSCDRRVAFTTASIIVPRKPFCSMAYRPAMVVPPGDATSSFNSAKCFLCSSAMRAAP